MFVWVEIELALAMMCASVPSLKGLISHSLRNRNIVQTPHEIRKVAKPGSLPSFGPLGPLQQGRDDDHDAVGQRGRLERARGLADAGERGDSRRGRGQDLGGSEDSTVHGCVNHPCGFPKIVEAVNGISPTWLALAVAASQFLYILPTERLFAVR